MLASFLCSYGVVDNDDLAESLVAGLMERLRAAVDINTADTAVAADANTAAGGDGVHVDGNEGRSKVDEGAADAGSLAAVPKAARNIPKGGKGKGGKGGKGKVAKKDNSGVKARRAEQKSKQQQQQQQQLMHEEQRHSQERDELGDEAATSSAAKVEAEAEAGAGAEVVTEEVSQRQAASDASSDTAIDDKAQVNSNK